MVATTLACVCVCGSVACKLCVCVRLKTDVRWIVKRACVFTVNGIWLHLHGLVQNILYIPKLCFYVL